MFTTLTRTSTLPSDSPTLRVVIADGLTMPRVTLRSMLARNGGRAVVGEPFDGAGAMKVVLEQRPHVLVLDLAMPGVLDALRQLRDSDTGVRPVVVAAAFRSQAVVTAITLGARRPSQERPAIGASRVREGRRARRLLDWRGARGRRRGSLRLCSRRCCGRCSSVAVMSVA